MGGLSWNIQEGFGAPFGRELNGRVMNRIQAAMTERHPFRPGLHVDDEVATPTSCVCSAAFIRRDSLQGKRRRDDTFDVDSMFLVYRVTPCALHNGLFGARSPQLVFLRETGEYPESVEHMEVTIVDGHNESMAWIIGHMDRLWIRWLISRGHQGEAEAYAQLRQVRFDD